MSAPRILIVRTSAMGDIVHALPVLLQLRQRLPEARIGWVVEDVFAPLLEGHPEIDRVLRVRLRQWRKLWFDRRAWSEVRDFHRNLDDFAPDIVLDLMGSHKAGIIAAWSLADQRYGLERSARREPSSAIWLSKTTKTRGLHAVDRMLSVLDALEPTEPVATEPDFGGDRLPARAWVEGPRPGEAFALLHPLTAWRNKNYPVASWSQVVKRLAREGDLPTWIAWGPGEESAAQELASRSGARALGALPSLPQLVALSREASIVLGGDTGPIHLAHAVGTRVVCVMGPTDPERNGPYGRSDFALTHRLPCSFCYRRLESTKACLLDLSPDRVADHALAALKPE